MAEPAVQNELGGIDSENLERRLGQKEATALVVGTVIGTGVFLKAAIMGTQTGSPFWVLIAWVVAGLLSLTGALCYAELGCLFPRAGGEYIYLREAYGDLTAFLYGWMRFWIGSPGSIAAYSVGCMTFASSIFIMGEGARGWGACVIIAIFTLINCFTVSVGGRLQTFLTNLKVLMILGLVVAIFVLGHGSWSNFTTHSGDGSFLGWNAFGTALIAALWAYDGWNNMPMAAGEIKNPGKSIPRALGLGMAVILGLYLIANLAYFYALPFSDVISSYSSVNNTALPVATKASLAAFGPVAVGILSFAFVISAIGSVNGSVLTNARVPFAMARDGLFFRQLGEVSRIGKSPVVSLVVQGLISCALALSGSFDDLTDYVVFGSWIFYMLCAASVIVFRRKLPSAERAYRTPWYPGLPIVFIICSLLLLINTVISSPPKTGIGLVFLIAGVPVYYIFAWSKKRKASAGSIGSP